MTTATGMIAPTSMRGERVYLRILEREDIPRTTVWINTDVVSDGLGYLPVKSLAQQLEWYESVKNDPTRYIFAICRNEDDHHIGNVGLGHIDYVHRHAMFSIFIADEKDRDRGAGTEATKLLLGFAFLRLNLNKVYLRTSARFTAAVRMYEKLGFVREGVWRQHYFIGGVYEDKILYSMLADEFLRTVQKSDQASL